MAQLSDVEGIGDKYAARLVEASIETMEQLLISGATRNGRKELSEKTGISPKLILKWVKHIDHFRVLGIKSKFRDLLKAARVDTVTQLLVQDPLDLFEMMVEVNRDLKLVKKTPSPRQVEDWIKTAGKLPKVIP
jgi:hypothetical protein